MSQQQSNKTTSPQSKQHQSTACQIFIKFLNVYIFFNTLFEIGYTFYEHSNYIKVPNNYQFYVLYPMLDENLDSLSDIASVAILAKQFSGSEFDYDIFNDEGCMTWTTQFQFIGGSMTAGKWTYADIKWKELPGSVTEKDVKAINNQIKPLFIGLQCVAILITILNMFIEYTSFDYPCCSKKVLQPSTLYQYMFICDICILPFYLMMGIGYGDKCIQESIILNIFTPFACSILPYIMFGVVILIVMGSYFGQIFQSVSKCLRVCLIMAGGLCMGSIIVSSPLYVGIPVVLKIIIQVGMIIYEKKQQAKEREKKVQEQGSILIPVEHIRQQMGIEVGEFAQQIFNFQQMTRQIQS